MDYSEAMAYIRETYKFGSKMGLERISRLLDMLGNPQKDLKFVHIAGTNGKGSTTSYISNILTEAGYKTGVFTSPYIQRFGERIKIDNIEISEEEIGEHIEVIKEKIDLLLEEEFPHPTEFEIITALAFMHYSRHACDVVVLEVGLGGIIDSTNVIDDSLVSVICTIGFDHTQYLGNTIGEIAEKKAGIIKENGTVVVYPQMEEAMKVIEDTCKEKNAVLYKMDPEMIEIIDDSKTDYQEFNFEEYPGLRIRLLGSHQIYNAALAVKAVKALIEKGYKITLSNIKAGLYNTKWPGRFEVVSTEPTVVVDGAHNEEAANVLAANIKKYFPNKKITFIVGVMGDKEYDKIFGPFYDMAYRFLAIAPNMERSLPVEELVRYISGYHSNVEGFDTVEEALSFALNTTMEDEIICCFGSLYYAGDVRAFFGLK